jgi:hypothetical protein
MSYGRCRLYGKLPDVTYGYGCLFLIGGLWAGIGSGILALSVTEPRSHLERFAGPLVTLWLVWLAMDLTGLTERLAEAWYLHDTDWFAALSALLVAGVCTVGPPSKPACILIMVPGRRLVSGIHNPDQPLGLHDAAARNWSGCVGLFPRCSICCARRTDCHRRSALGLSGRAVGLPLAIL